MSAVIRKRPQAKVDIVECADYIAQRNLAASERFLVAVERSLESIVRMPEAGTLWELGKSPFADMRYWTVKGFRKYLIFYRPVQRGIEVIRVLHSARDLIAAFEE
jgi:toxin ParE1/3/4